MFSILKYLLKDFTIKIIFILTQRPYQGRSKLKIFDYCSLDTPNVLLTENLGPGALKDYLNDYTIYDQFNVFLLKILTN